jgi:hypothetical protein
LFHNRFAGLCKIIILALPLTALLAPIAEAGRQTKLVGRVLAISYLSKIGFDPMHGKDGTQEFIFGVESKDHNGKVIVSPVFVRYPYAAYSGLLPEHFFDYSKKYKLSATKGKQYISLKDIAYMKIQCVDDDSNTPVPCPFADNRAWLQLEILKGVPASILNIDMDIMLPYYELSANKYETIKEKSQK